MCLLLSLDDTIQPSAALRHPDLLSSKKEITSKKNKKQKKQNVSINQLL